MRHSSLVMENLGSDGMPVKVVAAFGTLPAMIDAWILTRGRTTWLPGGPLPLAAATLVQTVLCLVRVRPRTHTTNQPGQASADSNGATTWAGR
jgi:hypothetical protein